MSRRDVVLELATTGRIDHQKGTKVELLSEPQANMTAYYGTY